MYTFVQLFMPYWNIEYTKAATYIYCGNVGGGIGQDPATEVTHSWDKSTSSFFQCTTSYQVWYELEV